MRHPPADLAALEAELCAERDALRRQRAEAPSLADCLFVVPWSGAHRPLFLVPDGGEMTPNPVSDEEIRDAIQPHWRTVHEQAAAADDALAAARRAHEGAGLFARFRSSRHALQAAQSALDDAALAKEALDLLWEGEAMRRQFEHNRTLADEAYRRALDATAPIRQLDERIAALDTEMTMLTALRAGGVTALERRHGETRAGALARALERITPDTEPESERRDMPDGAEDGDRLP